VRPEQGLLDRLVSVGLSHHAGAVPHERAAVAVDNRLKGRLRAVTDQLHEPFVRLHAQ